MHVTVNETRSFDFTFDRTGPGPGEEITPHQKLNLKPSTAEKSDLPSKVLNLIPPGKFVAASGVVAFTGDKAIAMPIDQIARTLQSSPMYQINNQTADSLAHQVKAAASSGWGRYVIVGVSGGLLTVGVCSIFWPKAVWQTKAAWFVGGALLLCALVWLLNSNGVIEPKKEPPSTTTQSGHK